MSLGLGLLLWLAPIHVIGNCTATVFSIVAQGSAGHGMPRHGNTSGERTQKRRKPVVAGQRGIVWGVVAAPPHVFLATASSCLAEFRHRPWMTICSLHHSDLCFPAVTVSLPAISGVIHDQSWPKSSSPYIHIRCYQSLEQNLHDLSRGRLAVVITLASPFLHLSLRTLSSSFPRQHFCFPFPFLPASLHFFHRVHNFFIIHCRRTATRRVCWHLHIIAI